MGEDGRAQSASFGASRSFETEAEMFIARRLVKFSGVRCVIGARGELCGREMFENWVGWLAEATAPNGVE